MNRSVLPQDLSETEAVWIMTAQIKKMGPNITLWAPRRESPEELPFRQHDRIVGESRLGPAPMTLVENPRILSGTDRPALPEFRFIRRLTDEDQPRLRTLAEREAGMLAFVRERAGVRSLPMIFVDAVGNLAGNDFLLYYTAEGRIDFRELLKDIHGRYRGRVELRQISPREHTSLLDGLGACGKTLCCASFLKSFRTISTKMAREADSEPNSLRSTGMCGRLKCCLSFEGAPASEEGSGGGCCSRKSRKEDRKEGQTEGRNEARNEARNEEWTPVTVSPGASPLSAASPEAAAPPPRSPDNRYRKESRSRG
jgi:cell fate regulator YaaT (PSP1 superfamily)